MQAALQPPEGRAGLFVKNGKAPGRRPANLDPPVVSQGEVGDEEGAIVSVLVEGIHAQVVHVASIKRVGPLEVNELAPPANLRNPNTHIGKSMA